MIIRRKQKQYSIGSKITRLTRKGVISSLKKAESIKQGVESIKYHTPGTLSTEIVKKSIENPVVVGGNIVGRVTDVIAPQTIVIPKSSIATVLGNKLIPKRGQVKLRQAARKYAGSNLARKTEAVVDGLVTSLKSIG